MSANERRRRLGGTEKSEVSGLACLTLDLLEILHHLGLRIVLGETTLLDEKALEGELHVGAVLLVILARVHERLRVGRDEVLNPV